MSRRYDVASHDSAGFARDAKKHLGQNFLHDRGVIDRIVLAVNPRRAIASSRSVPARAR